MWKRWIIVGFVLLTSCTAQRMVSQKSEMDQKRDRVECQGQANLAAGSDGYGLVHNLQVREYLKLCLEGRGWEVQR